MCAFEGCTKNLSCPELDILLRKPIAGQKATVRQAIDEILRLSMPDARAKRPSFNQNQIAEILGRSRDWVHDMIDVGINHGMIQVGEDGKPIKKVNELDSWTYKNTDKFSQDDLVKSWVEDLLTKNNGKPKKTWKHDLTSLKNFCNTLQITPAELVGDRTKESYLKHLKNLSLKLQTNPESYEHNKNGKGTVESIMHSMKMASRLFVQFHGIPLPKGIGGIASGKVIRHGQYADVRFTQEEIEKAKKYLIDTYGLDSDIFRVVMVGIQSGSRRTALLDMNTEWESHEKNGVRYFQMKAYETKTESSWKKYIYDFETQESLIIHRNNGHKKIIDVSIPKKIREDAITKQLRDLYTYMGKASLHDGYYLKRPFHALRHIAAQNWIIRLGGNLSIVANICGWKSDIELINSYGELPAQLVLEQIEKSFMGDNK